MAAAFWRVARARLAERLREKFTGHVDRGDEICIRREWHRLISSCRQHNSLDEASV